MGSQPVQAGRSCPATYGYSASSFRRLPELHAATLYVIGGLYGNLAALDALDRLIALEPLLPDCVFNGDFHWFDSDPSVFLQVHRRVVAHVALRGNVETELAGDDDAAGCGCAYPDEVDDADVMRSNQILQRLRATATDALGNTRVAMAQLPMTLVAQVGTARVGIVHGDATSLAGWDFARVRLDDPSCIGESERQQNAG